MAALVAAALVPAIVAAGPASATDAPAESDTVETDTGAGGDTPVAELDETLAAGAEVYSQTCSGCHQPGGAGLPGQFPPLLDNPNVQDTEYLITTIRNGRQGELTVLGDTYDGRMPAFNTLDDDDVDALVVYIQSGFQAPAVIIETPDGGVADGSLPDGAGFLAVVAYLVAAGVILLVLGPRITSANDRLRMPWLDAWLKTGVIVVGFVVFTVFVPSWAMQTETVSGLSRKTQDVVGVSLWGAGLLGGLWALWYAHRQDRI